MSARSSRTFPPFIVGHMSVICNDSQDDTRLSKKFGAISAFIRQARESPGGAVYVHCGAGISRAPTAVIAYLMTDCRLNFEDARALVKAARPCARPNEVSSLCRPQSVNPEGEG